MSPGYLAPGENIHGGGDLHGPAYSIRPQACRLAAPEKQTAIFDRDGVLNAIEQVYKDGDIGEERGAQTLQELEEVVYDRVEELFQRLRSRGYRVAVLTNRPDVGKHDRPLDLDTLELKGDRLIESGADIVEACPHRQEDHEDEYYFSNRLERFEDVSEDELPADREWEHKYQCSCHKPDAGMFRLLEDFLPVDWENSFMVGDSLSDLEAAKAHVENLGEEIGELYYIEHYKDDKPPEIAEVSFSDIDEFTEVILDSEAYSTVELKAGATALLERSTS